MGKRIYLSQRLNALFHRFFTEARSLVAAMLQDNSPPSPSEDPKGSKTGKILLWSLIGCGCFGFGGIVLLGILSALILPSFLNQAVKAKQSESKAYVGSLNRAQQAYFLEHETFADTIEPLGLGIPTETENYRYQVGMQPGQPPIAINFSTPLQEGLKGHLGLVFLSPLDDYSLTSNAVLCETLVPVSAAAPMPSPLPTAFMECPAGFVKL